jgi:predicted  nucleic acid-binding Zn-ribbon protein
MPEECANCGSTSISVNDDGITACDECGLVSRHTQEINEDQEQYMSSAGTINMRSFKKIRKGRRQVSADAAVCASADFRFQIALLSLVFTFKSPPD